jgi:phosphoribosylformylglycinamidine synthase I
VSPPDRTAPPIAIVAAPGTNRDGDAARAVSLAGGGPSLVLSPDELGRFAAVVVPGGFSYGDALGAGRRWALEIGEALAAVAGSGRPVLGICNGFQVLVRAGLFGPGLTLTHNAGLRFECRWVTLAVEPANAAGLGEGLISCPVAHGEGRLLGSLGPGARPLFRYVDPDGGPARGEYPANPNGSVDDIAGLTDAAGNVWGLMPHPEDHVDPAQDPFGRPGRSGLGLFQALVDRARAH